MKHTEVYQKSLSGDFTHTREFMKIVMRMICTGLTNIVHQIVLYQLKNRVFEEDESAEDTEARKRHTILWLSIALTASPRRIMIWG